MPDSPLELTDDDFASDAPPGYLSQKHKDRYTPLVITLLFLVFVAPFVLVFAVAIGGTPIFMAQAATQDVPQYTKLAAWQGALWYPKVNMFGGGGQGRSKLAAVDELGKPLERPEIELDMQPEWLIGDGERLWAVSNNEVAEIFADGSLPLVMRPERYLLQPSRPFVHDGKLSVLDRNDDGDAPFRWFTFDSGEWKEQGELLLPEPVSAPDPFGVQDAPADALVYENWQPTAETDVQEVMRRMNNGEIDIEAADQLAAVSTPAGLYVFAMVDATAYGRLGLPLKTADAKPAQWSDWELVVAGNGTAVQATIVAGEPTVLISGSNVWNLWRKTGDKWDALSVDPSIVRSGYLSDHGLLTLPDGRTLMVCEDFGGMGSSLLELRPDGVKKLATIGSPFSFNNPFTEAMLWQQGLMQLASNLPMVVQILLLTWLMKTHRDPNYYKGKTAVAYASILRRVIAVFFDTLIVYVPLGAIWYAWFLEEVGDLAETMKRLDDNPQDFFMTMVAPAAYTGAWLAFCAVGMWLMLGLFGCTPGKLLCGVRVARTNLERPGLLRALIRSIIWPFETGFFNGLAAFVLVAFTPNRQRLADLVGGTVVLKAGSLRKARQEAAL